MDYARFGACVLFFRGLITPVCGSYEHRTIYV